MFILLKMMENGRVRITQLARFLVVELTHSDLNHRFIMCITFITNYFSMGDDNPVDSDELLVTDFVNPLYLYKNIPL
jgi:hypothetical protein